MNRPKALSSRWLGSTRSGTVPVIGSGVGESCRDLTAHVLCPGIAQRLVGISTPSNLNLSQHCPSMTAVSLFNASISIVPDNSRTAKPTWYAYGYPNLENKLRAAGANLSCPKYLWVLDISRLFTTPKSWRLAPSIFLMYTLGVNDFLSIFFSKSL